MTEQKAPNPHPLPSASAKAQPTADWLEGRTIGKYKLVKRIGAGAFASIYEAVHIHLEVPFAIKVLHPAFASQEEIVKRFFREAQAASQLQHENVIFIADFEVAEDIGPYIVMEYLEGETLKSYLAREGSLPFDKIGDISRQICLALDMAHQKGIIHRDLKPENIFLIPRHMGHLLVKVLDFGIAHLTAARESITGAKLMGTPVYMAPEQFRGQVNSPSLDIYSFGVILYEMLVGQPPFQGQSVQRLGIEHLLLPAPELDERFPQALRQLQARLLGKTPEERPATMQECWKLLAEAIDPLLKHAHWHQEHSPPRRSFDSIPAIPSNTDTVIANLPSFPSRHEEIATERLPGFSKEALLSTSEEAHVSIALISESQDELHEVQEHDDFNPPTSPIETTQISPAPAPVTTTQISSYPPELSPLSTPILPIAIDEDNEETARYFLPPPTIPAESALPLSQEAQHTGTVRMILEEDSATLPPPATVTESPQDESPDPDTALKLEDHPALRIDLHSHLEDSTEDTLTGRQSIAPLSDSSFPEQTSPGTLSPPSLLASPNPSSALSTPDTSSLAEKTAPGTLQPPIVPTNTNTNTNTPEEKENPDPTGKTLSPFVHEKSPMSPLREDITSTRKHPWLQQIQYNIFRLNRRERRLLIVVWLGVFVAIGSLYFLIASEMWNPSPAKPTPRPAPRSNPRSNPRSVQTLRTVKTTAPVPSKNRRRYALFQHVGIMTVPSGADVFINGERMGQTPLKLLLEVDKTVQIRLQKLGFQDGQLTHKVKLVPEGSDAVMFTLQKPSSTRP